MIAPVKQIKSAGYERFLHALLLRIAEASEARLTVRCWSQNDLRRLVQQIRSDLIQQKVIKASFPRSKALINWLIESALISPVSGITLQGAKPAEVYYLIEIGAGPKSLLSPFELLQAAEPAGVICYFSAISFHGLSSQTPSSHHISILETRAAASKLTPIAAASERKLDGAHTPHRSRLGSLLFQFEEVSYYRTKRARDAVPGIQTQILDKRIQFRMTDLEQTLLDTLANPEACGGAAVVFEVWEQGWDRSQAEAILAYLKHQSAVMVRRFGALSDLLQLELDAATRSFLSESLSCQGADCTVVPLLRGSEGGSLDPKWRVQLSS